MIVIGHANLILDETYLVSTESRGYIQEPETPPFLPAPSLPSPPPLPDTGLLHPVPLPDLVPAVAARDSHSPGPVVFARPTLPHVGRQPLVVEMGHQGVQIRDLVHPAMTEPLRNQQLSTFKLIKLISDFNHQLSKIHEQHAEDLAQLVEAFRKKTSDVQNEGPRSGSSIGIAWEQWMADIMQDSACHTEISSTLGRAVARPLLEKTFHMKIQSRKVFTQRENFERLMADSEDILSKTHSDFRMSWCRHLEAPSPPSLTQYLESHNNYVGQLANLNAMTDQYYVEELPHLLQELDDVYHDVSQVVLESLSEGANKITEKTQSMTGRWKKTADAVRLISPVKDLNDFLTCLHIPDFVPVTKHKFCPPPAKEATSEEGLSAQALKELGLPIKTCDLVLDREVSQTARNRHEQLRGEAKTLETNIKLLSDSVESLIRIQAKNLEQGLFNKANEIQEEISRKRFELRCAQMSLAGIRAQKELFTAKNLAELEPKGAVEGVPAGGPRERKMSTSSTGNIKSKWVNAFKSIKNKQENGVKPVAASGGPPSIVENSHVFQEYTYKKITPCDVCSQVLRGHTRQGFKCKLCRMNIHTDCQEKVVKCQPKSKLLRRQKSGSEAPDKDLEDDSGFCPPEDELDTLVPPDLAPVLPPGAPGAPGAPGDPGGLGAPAPPGAQDRVSPFRRKMLGGSYSSYTPAQGQGAGLTLQVTDGELVDSRGRKIKGIQGPPGTPQQAANGRPPQML